MAYGVSDLTHYAQVKPASEPPQPNWKREYFESDVIFPLAWLGKELCTGAIIGYVIGREVAKRKVKTTDLVPVG